MTPEQQASFRHNSLRDSEVEMGAPSNPKEALLYYTEQRIEALTATPPDWNRYNLCGRRILELLPERPLGG